jgi:peptidoglycan hydrolase-like protein with peptidoglycan-binding domain
VRNQTSRKARAVTVADDDDWDDEDEARSFVGRLLARPKKDLIGLAACIVASGAIMINALFLQSGPHPAPLFSNIIPANPTAPTAETITMPPATKVAIRDVPVPRLAAPGMPAEATGALPVRLPRPRPELSPPNTVELPKVDLPAAPAPAPAPTAQRTRGELITEIQRELSRRGFYDGPVDGFYGPKTDGAIRDFEQAAKLKPSLEPTEVLLASILRSNVGAQAASSAAPQQRPPATIPGPQTRADAPQNSSPSSQRIVAVQRALAEWGYGQLRPTGQVDTETKTAIERFERERRLPITGHLSDRVTRELAAVTGRPLE